jgi:hypothetical protein
MSRCPAKAATSGSGRPAITRRLYYNQRRPYGSLGHLTPNEFVEQRQVIQSIEEAVCSG